VHLASSLESPYVCHLAKTHGSISLVPRLQGLGSKHIPEAVPSEVCPEMEGLANGAVVHPPTTKLKSLEFLHWFPG
jgi:hypothetical protein